MSGYGLRPEPRLRGIIWRGRFYSQFIRRRRQGRCDKLGFPKQPLGCAPAVSAPEESDRCGRYSRRLWGRHPGLQRRGGPNVAVPVDAFRRWPVWPQRLKAGKAIIELLRREGVSQIFGIVGSSFLDILDPLYDRDDIRFVGVRHEQGGALMADGYSRISGAPSVCLVTNGPGVLNLTYGIASAYVAHSPVVVLAPSASRDHQHRDSTQEFDQVALFPAHHQGRFPNQQDRAAARRHTARLSGGYLG